MKKGNPKENVIFEVLMAAEELRKTEVSLDIYHVSKAILGVLYKGKGAISGRKKICAIFLKIPALKLNFRNDKKKKNKKTNSEWCPLHLGVLGLPREKFPP